MKFNENIPTIFAVSLAEATGIVVKAKPGQNHKDYLERIDRLRAFQQMAVVVTFEESLIAFHGQDLDETQSAALEIIFKSTKPWMLGHVVGVLLNRLEKHMTNRDFAESVRTIIEQLTKDGDGSEQTKKIKGMLVEFTTD